MRKPFHRRATPRRRTPPGAPPGTLVPDPAAVRPVIRVIAYGPDELVEREVRDPAEIESLRAASRTIWVNVDGLGDVETIRRLGEIFELHQLSLEDVVNVHQRPKAEEYDKYLFLVARMAEAGPELASEQISLFLGDSFVLTFQERPGDSFDPIRERIRRHRGRLREAGPDYLAYALLDAVIDAYFPVLETIGEEIQRLEDAVLAEPGAEVISRIHAAKRDMLTLRRAIWPQRDAVNALIREASPFITAQTRVYLRDCYDHTIQLMDMIETYREIASGLVDIYLSSLTHRTNQVMTLLAIIATIFIPLTFIAGVYGMNFDPEASPWNMPELNWYWGYPFALGLMAAIGLGLVYYFYRKGWIGRRSTLSLPLPGAAPGSASRTAEVHRTDLSTNRTARPAQSGDGGTAARRSN